MTVETRILDHAEARRLAALTLDGALDASDRSALDAHLATCPACRAVADAMGRDAEALRALDLGPVPVAVRANVAIAAEHRGRGGSVGRWGVILMVGVLLIAGISSGLVGGGGSRAAATPGPTGADAAAANVVPDQISWKSDVALLTAQGFSVQAGDKTFSGRAPAQINSDPGDATYRTLEATWTEQGVQMRVNLYFSGDATSWWVSEIRAYDGKATPKAEWMTATGKWFQSPIGQPWTGDIDVPLKGVGIGGSLHLAAATIATHAVDNVTEPLGGGKPVGQNDRPFGPGGQLHCTGILQMAPADAEAALLSLGYRLSWRRETTTGPNTGNSEAMPHAPDGVIVQEPAPGSSGELILFVAPFGDPNAKPIPYPSDCTGADPNQTPPAPKP